jgi:uncharacterized protein YndB with AHSA1/START domain
MNEKGSAGLTIIRSFKAPKTLVFDAFTDPESMAAWWGPRDNPISVETLDCTAGGVFHYSQDMMGERVFGRFLFHRVERPDLLEFSFTFADLHCNPVRAFFSESWPMEVFNRVVFDEKNGATTITMTGHPLNATEEEIVLYLANLENMQQGFSGTFDQLEQYLTIKQAK